MYVRGEGRGGTGLLQNASFKLTKTVATFKIVKVSLCCETRLYYDRSADVEEKIMTNEKEAFERFVVGAGYASVNGW